MKVSDLVSGLVFAGLGIVIIWAAALQPQPIFGSAYGGGYFPKFIGVGLLGAGLMLAFGGWRVRQRQPLVVLGEWTSSSRHLGNVVVVLAAITGYIVLSGRLGFLITAYVVLFAVLFQFSRRFFLSLVVSAVTVLVLKIAFQDVLLVPLPWGVLRPYAGVLSWR